MTRQAIRVGRRFQHRRTDYGSLKTFTENTGLVHALNNKHGSHNVPPTREPGSKVIDYVLVSEGLIPHITSIGMLSQDAVFASDHRSFFMDLDAVSYFGHEPDDMPAK
jgi:endonuclease/exonuclease/phosphatase family metal-dependent hydrolase